MKRSPMPRPTKPIARTTPVKKRNPERRSAEFIRTYGSELRCRWMQAQPSVVSGRGPCVNAHIRGDGAGRKADAEWIVSLTNAEHEELHRIGAASFEKQYGLSLYLAAKHTERQWRLYLKSPYDF